MAVSSKTLQLSARAADMAIQGSGYGESAWLILRNCLLHNRDMSVDEASKIEDLIDRAADDVEGQGLRVDLQLEKVY